MSGADITLEDQIACVEREIRLRERAYPRWVRAGRMSQEKAEREIDAMSAVLETLRAKKRARTPNQKELAL